MDMLTWKEHKMSALLTSQRTSRHNQPFCDKTEILHLIFKECNAGETDADDEFIQITDRKWG